MRACNNRSFISALRQITSLARLFGLSFIHSFFAVHTQVWTFNKIYLRGAFLSNNNKKTTSLSRERDRFAPLWSKFQTLANNTVLCSAHHGPSPSIPNWVCIPKCGCQVPRVLKSRLGNGFFGFCNLNVLPILSAARFLNKTWTLALAWLQI